MKNKVFKELTFIKRKKSNFSNSKVVSYSFWSDFNRDWIKLLPIIKYLLRELIKILYHLFMDNDS